MSPRMKRVLYALAVGLIFVLLTSITDAATPQANLLVKIDATRSTTSTKATSKTKGSSSIRVARQADRNRQTQQLFLQQPFLQPQFIAIPSRGAVTVPVAAPASNPTVARPQVFANQFVPLTGSGQSAFREIGLGGYGSSKPDPQRIHRISFGK